MERRQKRSRPQASAEEGLASSGEFDFNRLCGNAKDLQGESTLRWHPDGNCVQVSTAHPYWWSEKIICHAVAAGSAFFDRQTLKKLKEVPEEELSKLAAQVSARSFATKNFMGLSYKRLIAADTRLEKKYAEQAQEIARLKEAELKQYDTDNPVFQDEVFPHVAKGIDAALDPLRERGGLVQGFKDFNFSDVFPSLKKKLEEIIRKAKGKTKVDESSSEEEEDDENEAVVEENEAGKEGENAADGEDGNNSASEADGTESETDRAEDQETEGSSGSSSGSTSSSSGSGTYSPDVDIEGGGNSSSPVAKKLKPQD